MANETIRLDICPVRLGVGHWNSFSLEMSRETERSSIIDTYFLEIFHVCRNNGCTEESDRLDYCLIRTGLIIGKEELKDTDQTRPGNISTY